MPSEDTLQEKLKTWEKQGTPLAVELSEAHHKRTQGKAYLRSWNQKERLWRGGKGWLGAWLIGVVAVFLPILHFVLVPLFALLGPFAGFYFYSQTSVILGGVGECPSCGKELEIAKSKPQWPLEDLCLHCRESVTIEPRNA